MSDFPTTTFRGRTYRKTRNMWCPVSRGPMVAGTIFVGPDTETWTQLRAMLFVTTSPLYLTPTLMEDTYGPWSDDIPEESMESAAMLLAAAHGFTWGEMKHRSSAWGQPIKDREGTT